MFDPSHLPNKQEIIMSFVCVFIAVILAGVIFPLIISTDKLPLVMIVGLFLSIFLMILLGVQSIFNIYYKRYQKKLKKAKKK